MERYEAYKDSRIKWVGQIPASWEEGTLAHFAEILGSGATPPTDNDLYYDGGIPWLQVRDLGKGRVAAASRTITKKALEDLSIVRVYRAPFLAIAMYASIGSISFVKQDSAVNQAICAIANGGMDLRYLYYHLLSWEPYLLADGQGGTQKNISQQYLRKLGILVPTLNEQQAIADYLDAKTAEIDALVADCEREVGLLREYRKAVISEAVTKGLDPDTPMKDSGVEWIGKIPEGWLVRPSKTLFAEGKELRRPNDEQCTASQKHGIIPQAQYIALENQRMVAADKNLDAWKHVEPNDFVISLRSFQGGLELSTVAGCITWHYIVLKGNCLVESAYYKYLFKTRKYIESLQRTCTYIRDGQDLRYSNFVQVPLPLPPKIEQVEIGAYLDAKTAEIDSLIDAKQSMADKLREYRRSLISEAVTGKFKVPGV